MTEKKIVVSCSFREFDGSENAKIQEMFLESIKAQTHKNITLAVTNFHEKTVEDYIANCGLDYVFFQSKLDVQYYSISEVCYNAASLMTPGDSIFLHTSADHIFPPHFFKTVAARMPRLGSVTSFPQKVYDGTIAYKAGKSIEDGHKELRLDRGILKEFDDTDLPGLYAMDPNHWLPDTVAVDGDLFLQDDALERLMDPRFLQMDISPGVAQNTLLAFLAKPGKRKNIVMEARYVELLNDYTTDDRAVEGAKTFAENRRNQDDILAGNWQRLNDYCKDVGMQPYEYEDGPFVKLNQVALYEPTGSHTQKAAFAAYLELWKLRYLVRSHRVSPSDEVTEALNQLKKTITLLDKIQAPIPMDDIERYSGIWLYGASAFGDSVFDILKEKAFTVKGVADTYQTGNWKDYEIRSPEQLKSEIGAGDVIYISSEYWKEISQSLRELGIENDIVTNKDGSCSTTTITVDLID